MTDFPHSVETVGLGRTPLHENGRDEGQDGEEDPEDEERRHPPGLFLPFQPGQAQDPHGYAGCRQDGIDILGQLEGEGGRLPGDADEVAENRKQRGQIYLFLLT